ncbi:MAG: hypothetical protein D6717_12310, partial [Gammaproteobacteria bacterium]
MIIQPNNTQLARLLGSGQLQGIRLAPGQRLEATVLPPQPGTPPGSITVRAGGLEFRLRIDLPVQPGTRLNLEVVEAGTRPLFALREGQPATATSATTTAASLPAAGQAAEKALAGLRNLLQQTLPLQQSLPAALAGLRALAERPDLPAAVRQSLDSLFRPLPRQRALETPEGLRQALERLGLAPRRSGGSTPAEGDLKQGLLRLIARLERELASASAAQPGAARTAGGRNTEIPPPLGRWPQAQPAVRLAPDTSPASRPEALMEQLLQQAEAALSRLRLLQAGPALSRHGGDTAQAQPLRLELPFLHPDGSLGVVALYIERDEAGGSAEPAEAEPTWRVRLALD